MDWLEDRQDDGEEQGITSAFTLIHEGPGLIAGGKQKTHKGKQTDVLRSLQLAAFPQLFQGEPEEHRLARAAAAQRCWDELANNIQETLEGADAGVFQSLLEFAQQSHRPPGPRWEQFPGCQRLPTGLVLAGGVNSADHCHTFPNLAAFLRQHGCYVALLQPHSFGKVPGDAVREILRQVSGLSSSKAEHMAALQQWYRDETAADLAAAEERQQQAQGPAAAAPGTAGEQQQQQAAAGGAAEGRSLRQRPTTGAGAATAAQLANRQRPLVLIVEGTESVDSKCLWDLILTASEVYSEVPLTLVLGLTTNAAALNSLLPSEVIDRCTELHHFKLAPAMSRLDSLMERVLLGGSGRWPSLLFSFRLLSELVEAFMNHYYSTGCISQGLRLASLEHFRCQLASSLAAAALDGPKALEKACAALPPSVLTKLKQQLRVRSPRQLADSVTEAQAGWSRWALGVHWLVLAARAVGLDTTDFRHWRLCRDALATNFAAKDGELQQLLKQLEPLLKKLSPAAVQQLAAQLEERAGEVWGAAEAAEPELAGVAAFVQEEEEGAEEAEGEDGDRAQQGAAPPAAAPAEEAQADEQQQQQQQQAGKKAGRRDKFHSKEARMAAMLQKAKEQAAAGKGGSAAAAKAAKEANVPGVRFAAWLAPALRAMLATPPTKLPGAAVFSCSDATALQCMTAEPRQALHLALTAPHNFLPGVPADMGLCADQEDACLAYRLYDTDPSCANLADWYQAFAAVHTQGAAGGDEAAGGSAGKKRKKAAVKKTKQAKAAEAGGSGGAAEQAEEKRRVLREVAARFSQATAELQYVGLIKPAKRRRGDFVQRVVHMPAAE